LARDIPKIRNFRDARLFKRNFADYGENIFEEECKRDEISVGSMEATVRDRRTRFQNETEMKLPKQIPPIITDQHFLTKRIAESKDFLTPKRQHYANRNKVDDASDPYSRRHDSSYHSQVKRRASPQRYLNDDQTPEMDDARNLVRNAIEQDHPGIPTKRAQDLVRNAILGGGYDHAHHPGTKEMLRRAILEEEPHYDQQPTASPGRRSASWQPRFDHTPSRRRTRHHRQGSNHSRGHSGDYWSRKRRSDRAHGYNRPSRLQRRRYYSDADTYAHSTYRDDEECSTDSIEYDGRYILRGRKPSHSRHHSSRDRRYVDPTLPDTLSPSERRDWNLQTTEEQLERLKGAARREALIAQAKLNEAIDKQKLLEKLSSNDNVEMVKQALNRMKNQTTDATFKRLNNLIHDSSANGRTRRNSTGDLFE